MEDYKEKYEQAMIRMNKWVEGSEIIDPKEVAEFVFPELKESEDERIRKGIIRNLEYLMDRAEGFVKEELQQRIAWLEKQDEQKPAWSEDDEKMLNKCIEYASTIVPIPPTNESGSFVNFKRIPDEKAQGWLKSLKERMKG